jgi:hypothetical protein
MKSYLLILGFLLAGFNMKGQVTLEKAYSGYTQYAFLEGDYYFSLDYANHKCSVYNLEHNLIKTINIQVDAGWYLYDVIYLSKNVFNDDDKLEFVVVFNKYVSDDENSGHFVYLTKVVNEDGNVLTSIDGGGYTYVYENKNGKIKMLVYVYDFSDYVYISKTNIYSLAGELPSAIKGHSDVSLQNAYPNPASSQIHIPYELKSSDGQAAIILMNMNGQEIFRKTLKNTKGQEIFDTRNLSPGQYIYYLEQNGRRTPARKIVIK